MYKILGWVTFFLLILFIGFNIANVVYYHRIKDSTVPNPSVSKGSAQTMITVNVAMIVIQVIFDIIILVLLLKHHSGESSDGSTCESVCEINLRKKDGMLMIRNNGKFKPLEPISQEIVCDKGKVKLNYSG